MVPNVHVGDLIVKTIPNKYGHSPITTGQPYEVVEIRDRSIVIINDAGRRYLVSHIYIHNRWIVVEPVNDKLIYLLKED